VYFSREGSFVTPFLPHCFNALGMVPMPFGKLVRRGWERLERRAVNCGEHVFREPSWQFLKGFVELASKGTQSPMGKWSRGDTPKTAKCG
jgi:hypothetical protein